jgi:hypothetical protein
MKRSLILALVLLINGCTCILEMPAPTLAETKDAGSEGGDQ